MKEQILLRVFEEINDAVNAQFGDYLEVMGFCADWCCDGDIENELSLNYEDASFSIYYASLSKTDMLGIYAYDPLVEFIFNIDEASLSEKTAKKLFQRMKTPLDKILKATYLRWTESMSGYYRYLHDNADRPKTIRGSLNPREYPERFFLYHRVIDLR